MDATQIITNMNDRWAEMLSGYYDHVSTTFLKHIAEEYDLDYDELVQKSISAKDEIVEMATNNASVNNTSVKKKKPSMSALKNARKAEIDAQREKNAYSDHNRSMLIEACRERRLPIKRKNQDMVDNLLEFDKKKKEDAEEN